LTFIRRRTIFHFSHAAAEDCCIKSCGKFLLSGFYINRKFPANIPAQDSTSESAATADTTLDITEMITAMIMINNPPPNTINITEILL